MVVAVSKKSYGAHLLSGLIISPFLGMVGFLSGIAVTALTAASGLSSISTVPIGDVTAIFTAMALVIGFGWGVKSSMDDESA